MTRPPASTSTSNLALPRILCLHGGGVNAQVFELQCRVIISRLKTSFRLVFVDGPFPSEAHPAIVQVFGELGPFYSWLRWLPDQPDVDPDAAAREVVYACRRAMDLDSGTGEWAGVLGFSQGAKIAASLLWAQERIEREGREGRAETGFRFGVIMAGRAPVVQLDPRLSTPRHVVDAARLSSDFDDWPERNEGGHVLSMPTLHVHGLRDPGLEQHRMLMDKYCETGSADLVEWDGEHRLPIKSGDVDAVVRGILDLAERTRA